jgi:hypothetical protein
VVQVTTPHSRITQRITKNKATAVPSLKRLSHSNNIVSLLGAQSDLNIDKTATGSVAEISDQNSKQTKNGISSQIKGKSKYKTQPINQVDISKPNIAREDIVLQFANMCL